ncbi:unnamed protein product [Rotaria socialis]
MCYFNPYVSTSYKILFNECLENDYFLKNSSNRAYLFPHFGDPISRHFVSVENILHLDENEKKSSSINYQSDFLFHACSGYTHRAQYSQLHWPGDASVDWNIYSGENWIDISTNLIYDHDTDGRYRLGKTDIFHGGQWIMNVRDDLLTIPLFARADSIIPPIDSSAFT